MMDATDDVTKAREEYYMMVNQIIDSKEQGYEHYNRYAKGERFTVRLDDDKECVAGTKELRGKKTFRLLKRRVPFAEVLVSY